MVSRPVITRKEKKEMSPYYYLMIGMVIAAAFIYWRWGREARRRHSDD